MSPIDTVIGGGSAKDGAASVTLTYTADGSCPWAGSCNVNEARPFEKKECNLLCRKLIPYRSLLCEDLLDHWTMLTDMLDNCQLQSALKQGSSQHRSLKLLCDYELG